MIGGRTLSQVFTTAHGLTQTGVQVALERRLTAGDLATAPSTPQRGRGATGYQRLPGPSGGDAALLPFFFSAHQLRVVATGAPSAIAKTDTATGRALRAKLSLHAARTTSDSSNLALEIEHAREHNLQDVSVSLPHGALTVVTGVLGASLAKREGLRVVTQWQRAMAEGAVPEAGLAEGLLVLVGGGAGPGGEAGRGDRLCWAGVWAVEPSGAVQ